MKKILTALSIASISYLSAAALTTDKPVYTTTDTIKINFSEMDNHHKDWIGIYPEGSSTAWKNVVKWAWTENKSEGTLTFKNLPAGEYEVKGFYNNSYDAEATKAFKVQGTGAKAELTPTKTVFTTTEDVRINFKNINGATNDWLAIYPNFLNNDWENVVKWKFNKGGVKAGQANFDKLPIGEYEARVFYNNSFKLEGKVYFKVNPDVNDYDERFYTEDRRYSFAYLRTNDLVGRSIARWYVLDNKNTIVDESAGKYNLHFNKIDGVDLFTISQTQTGTTTFYRINSGKLIRLNLEFPAGEPKSVNVIKKGGKTILEMHYYEKYTYRYDVTDLANVKFISESNKPL